MVALAGAREVDEVVAWYPLVGPGCDEMTGNMWGLLHTELILKLYTRLQ